MRRAQPRTPPGPQTRRSALLVLFSEGEDGLDWTVSCQPGRARVFATVASFSCSPDGQAANARTYLHVCDRASRNVAYALRMLRRACKLMTAMKRLAPLKTVSERPRLRSCF